MAVQESGGTAGASDILTDGQGFPRNVQDVLFRTRSHLAICDPLEVTRQTVSPSLASTLGPRHLQSSPASAGVAKTVKEITIENKMRMIYYSTKCNIRHSARLIQTGTWSDGFSQALTCLSIPTDNRRSAASGESSRWSIRIPLFFCHAPAW